MKKLVYSIVVSGALLASCKNAPQKPEGGYLVQGEVIGYDEPYLYEKSREGIKYSIKVENGKFTMVGKLDQPKSLFLGQKAAYDKSFSFYLDNADIKVKVDFTKDQFKEKEAFLNITGSPAQDLVDKIEKDFKSSEDKYKGASRSSTIDYKTGAFYYLLSAKPEEYVNSVSLEQAYYFFAYQLPTNKFPVENAEKLLGLFTEKFGNTEQYKSMQAKIAAGKKREEGVPFIDYVSKDVDGKEVKLSKYYGKSYILVDLWASWCGPCRAENPHYKEALKRYGKKGLKIFSISFDSKKKDWVKAIKEDKIYDFVHVSDLSHYDNPVAKTYKISGIPDNFLLDKNGKIIDNGLRGEELLETLEHLYSK